MAHVVLGLLMLWPQSLYDLTKNFEAGISLFYSASVGSIKRALDRLLADGHIEVAAEEGPRGRKVYAITDTGRDEFRRWMVGDLSGADIETAALSRAYFLGLVDADERRAIAANVQERIGWQLRRLERLEANVSTAEVPEGFEEVAQYQLATLQYGLNATRTALAWAEEYLPQQPSQ